MNLYALPAVNISEHNFFFYKWGHNIVRKDYEISIEMNLTNPFVKKNLALKKITLSLMQKKIN